MRCSKDLFDAIIKFEKSQDFTMNTLSIHFSCGAHFFFVVFLLFVYFRKWNQSTKEHDKKQTNKKVRKKKNQN